MQIKITGGEVTITLTKAEQRQLQATAMIVRALLKHHDDLADADECHTPEGVLDELVRRYCTNGEAEDGAT